MPLSVSVFSYSINEDSDSSMSSLLTPPRYAQEIYLFILHLCINAFIKKQHKLDWFTLNFVYKE